MALRHYVRLTSFDAEEDIGVLEDACFPGSSIKADMTLVSPEHMAINSLYTVIGDVYFIASFVS